MLGNHPNLLLVGAASKDVGKTELSCHIISKFRSKFSISAIKVTVIDKPDKPYSRIKENYVITEETDPSGSKDTNRLLAAGAKPVFWLRVKREHLQEGAEALSKKITTDSLWVCESNSIREFVKPGVFLMVAGQGDSTCKPSAKKNWKDADCIVCSMQYDSSFDLDLDRLTFEHNRWALKENASAAVLAGGQSSRMGSDKGMLKVKGHPMIEYVADQLRGNFNELVISSVSDDDYQFLGLPVVADTEPDRGPLMGIVSILEHTVSDLNFITACDLPDINMPFVRRMLREAAQGDFDIVVPRNSDGSVEPLHAIYNMRVAKKAKDLLNEGENKIRALFDYCEVGYMELCPFELRNLNTKEQYENYCQEEAHR